MVQGNKPPNFLQKLYDFLAIDPHPCPDIIYWASDSRQLVIAQPERLAKEVLPKLFKHDKIASFGRQLNIYGFSRLFPGRQFKDAEGNISDASVWAHPTLNRLSLASELATIKRRAPPKLVRTRRLANGEVVRTKAGPGVVEKAKRVKEAMTKDRERTWGQPVQVGAGPEGNTVSCAQKGGETEMMNVNLDVQPDVAVMKTDNAFRGRLQPEAPAWDGQLRSLHSFPSETNFVPQSGHTQGHNDVQISSIPITTLVSSLETARAPQSGTGPLTQWSPHPATTTVLKDRPYVSCPASIHTSPTVPSRPAPYARPSGTWTRKNAYAETQTGSLLGTDGTGSSFSFNSKSSTLTVSGSKPSLKISTNGSDPVLTSMPGQLAPTAFHSSNLSSSVWYAPASVNSEAPQALLPSYTASQGTANHTHRIAAPAALLPTHLLPQPSASPGYAGTSHGTTMNTHFRPVEPSPTDLTLPTPQTQTQPYPYPALSSGSVGATVPSSFAVTPLCNSTEQSTYVRACWDREGSWARTQARIAGQYGVGGGGGGGDGHVTMGGLGSSFLTTVHSAMPGGDVSSKPQTGVGVGVGAGGNGTIDPKWVSPAGSVWSTPSATRVPSPVHGGNVAKPSACSGIEVSRRPATSHLQDVKTSRQHEAAHSPGNVDIVQSEASNSWPFGTTGKVDSVQTAAPPSFVFYDPVHLPSLGRLDESEDESSSAGTDSPAVSLGVWSPRVPSGLRSTVLGDSLDLGNVGPGPHSWHSPSSPNTLTEGNVFGNGTGARNNGNDNCNSDGNGCGTQTYSPFRSPFLLSRGNNHTGLGDMGSSGSGHNKHDGLRPFVHKQSPLVPIALPPTPMSTRATSADCVYQYQYQGAHGHGLHGHADGEPKPSNCDGGVDMLSPGTQTSALPGYQSQTQSQGQGQPQAQASKGSSCHSPQPVEPFYSTLDTGSKWYD